MQWVCHSKATAFSLSQLWINILGKPKMQITNGCRLLPLSLLLKFGLNTIIFYLFIIVFIQIWKNKKMNLSSRLSGNKWLSFVTAKSAA